MEKGEKIEIEVEADSAEELLRSWLKEILYVIEDQALVIRTFHFEIISIGKQQATPCYLKGFLVGEPFKSSRHNFCTEIKAITRHDFKIKKSFFIWKANLIFDV